MFDFRNGNNLIKVKCEKCIECSLNYIKENIVKKEKTR